MGLKKIYICNVVVLLFALVVLGLFGLVNNDVLIVLLAVQFCVHFVFVMYAFIRHSLKLAGHSTDLMNEFKLPFVVLVLFMSLLLAATFWHEWYIDLFELNSTDALQTLLVLVSIGMGLTAVVLFGMAVISVQMRIASGLYKKVVR